MADDILPEGIDALLGLLTRELLNQAAAREARLLAEARANLLSVSDGYHLSLRVPEPLYRRLCRAAPEGPGAPDVASLKGGAPQGPRGVRESEERIRRCAQRLLEPLMIDKIKPVKVSITMMLAPPPNWRENTMAMLRPFDPLGHRPHVAASAPPRVDKFRTTEDFNIGVDSPGYDPSRRPR